MIGGSMGRFIFLASLAVAFLAVCLEVFVAFHPGVATPADIHTVLIASLAFAAGASGITPGIGGGG